MNWGNFAKFLDYCGPTLGRPTRPAPPPFPVPPPEEPEPFPTELPAMLEELERQFARNPHWTGSGPVTRPIVLMARIVAELAVRAK